jgi:hypothetical protein
MSEQDKNTTSTVDVVPGISFVEFLETIPQNQRRQIEDLLHSYSASYGMDFRLNTSEILLHCDHDNCQGPRYYRPARDIDLNRNEVSSMFVYYKCSNCAENVKVYALHCSTDKEGNSGICIKLGEIPSFGPPTPPKLQKLIQPDRELFMKGRQCETHGLGVGAFTYYRRVVEDQKDRILNEIIKVAKQIGGMPDVIVDLQTAKKEIQFTKAIGDMKHGIPESLMIEGQNPLLLLHRALSEGIHSHTDEECLDMATNIRIVLTELSERLGIALKDDQKLKTAVKSLSKPKKKK